MAEITPIQFLRGTAAQWASANPTLTAGKPGFETDTRKLKIGDGATAWNSLPYIAIPVSIDNTMAAASDSLVPSQKAVKEFVENASLGLVSAWKNPVDLATTANITLSGEQTIDGVLTSGSRVLVKNQSTASQNGIYVSGAGAWTRATDMDASVEFNGAAVSVLSGSTNDNTSWVQTAVNPTVGSTSIVWAQIGTSVPDADATTKGILKLYPSTSLGNNADGAATQNAVKVYIDALIAAIDGPDFIETYLSKTASFGIDAGNLTSINAGALLVYIYDAVSGGTFTLPNNTTRAVPVGGVVQFIQLNSGQLTIAAEGGSTMQSANNANKTYGQYSAGWARKTATNTWMIGGDLTP